MLPVNRRTPESPRAVERAGGTKSEVGVQMPIVTINPYLGNA